MSQTKKNNSMIVKYREKKKKKKNIMIMKTAHSKIFRARLREKSKLTRLKVIMIKRILKVKMQKKKKKSNRHRKSSKLWLRNKQRIEVQSMAMVRLKFKETQGLCRLFNLRKTKRPLYKKEIFTLWTIFNSKNKAQIQRRRITIIGMLKWQTLLTINKNSKQELLVIVYHQYSVGRGLSWRRLIM